MATERFDSIPGGFDIAQRLGKEIRPLLFGNLYLNNLPRESIFHEDYPPIVAPHPVAPLLDIINFDGKRSHFSAHDGTSGNVPF